MHTQPSPQCFQLVFTLYSSRTNLTLLTAAPMIDLPPKDFTPVCTPESSKMIKMDTSFYAFFVNEALNTTLAQSFIRVEKNVDQSELDRFLMAIFETRFLDSAKNPILGTMLSAYDSSKSLKNSHPQSQCFFSSAFVYHIYDTLLGSPSKENRERTLEVTEKLKRRFEFHRIHVLPAELKFFEYYLKKNRLAFKRAIVAPSANAELLNVLENNEYFKKNRIPFLQQKEEFDVFAADYDLPAFVSKNVFQRNNGLHLLDIWFWKLEFKYAFDVVDLKESPYKYLKVIENFQYLEDATFAGVVLPLSSKMKKLSIGLIELKQKQPFWQVPFDRSFLKSLIKAPLEVIEVYLPSFNNHQGFMTSLHEMLGLSIHEFRRWSPFNHLESTFRFDHLFHICVDQTGDIPMTKPFGKSTSQKAFKLDSAFYLAIIDNTTGSLLLHVPIEPSTFLPKGHEGCNNFKWKSD